MKSRLFVVAAAFPGMIAGIATAYAVECAGGGGCRGFKPAVVAATPARAVAHPNRARIRLVARAKSAATAGRGNTAAKRVGRNCASHIGVCRRDRLHLIAGRSRVDPGAGAIIAESPASFVNNLGDRAIAAMRGGDIAVQQWRFRQLYRQYFDTEACARAALGPYWQYATAQQRQEFISRYEDYVVFAYSLPLGQIGAQSFKVLGSQPDKEGVIVMSRIDGAVRLDVNWRLNPTAVGYKVTDVIVSGIDMANLQRSDMISVIQRNSGQMQPLLAVLRDKNASNGITR
ncbi:MAG: ABC transporter substrate-binding protein [Alphaproteobacteria bacterium]|nr:ABC transporter substrate-binding protein [Alphaproteobacteria bacterium]